PRAIVFGGLVVAAQATPVEPDACARAGGTFAVNLSLDPGRSGAAALAVLHDGCPRCRGSDRSAACRPFRAVVGTRLVGGRRRPRPGARRRIAAALVPQLE